MILAAIFALIAAVIAYLAWAGRHDRPSGVTLWMWISAALFSLVPMALLGDAVGGTAGMWILAGWLLLILFGGFGAGLVIDRKDARDRKASKQLALAAGMPEDEARRKYRRQPRSPWTILALYVLASYVWVFALVGVGSIWPRTQDWLMGTAFTVAPASATDVPYDMPRFIAGVALIALAGLIHTFVNAARR